MGIGSQAEKVKAVRIFQGLARQIGLRFGQMALDITHGVAVALQQTGLDLDGEDIARSVVLDCLSGAPAAGFGAGEFVQKRQLVIPRQLCKHTLHKFRIRPRLGKSAHVLEITR